ncbi:MAG: FliH/SctL family protein [Aquificaceae bacterium]|nr:FliH/SctL family protein [Aquificaceae bacterium]
MYKGTFKPLYPQHMEEPPEEERLQESKEEPDCKEVELHYRAKLEALAQEAEALRLRVKELQVEKEELLKERERLLNNLSEREGEEKMIEAIGKSLKELFKNAETKLREEVLESAVELLKKLLLTDLLPKEEVLVRALSKVFERGIELRGQVNLYLSPRDFQRLGAYVESLKNKLGDNLNLKVLTKEELMEGEFVMETPKLWIERRYEHILQDLREEMKNGGSLQDIS